MSLIRNNSTDNNLDWRADKLFDLGSDWVLNRAVRHSNDITIQSQGKMSLVVNIEPTKAENIKLHILLNSNDETLSTAQYKKVAVSMKFFYVGTADNTLDVDTKIYYPKYTFESDWDGGDCIVDLYNNRELVKIQVVVYNYELVNIKIDDIYMCLNYTYKDEVEQIGMEHGWGGEHTTFTYNNKIPQFPSSGEGIENSSIWYDMAYENMGYSTSQMVALSQYNRLLGASIESDIGVGSGSVLGQMFDTLIRTSSTFRDAARNSIELVTAVLDEDEGTGDENEEPSGSEE